MEFKLFTSTLFGNDKVFCELFVCWAMTKEEAQLRHAQRSDLDIKTFRGWSGVEEGIDEKTLKSYLQEGVLLDLREDSQNQDFTFLLSIRTF